MRGGSLHNYIHLIWSKVRSMTDPLALFDLPRFMFSRFAGVEFGGDLFSQWPVGLRFEVGLEQVWRAAEIHEFIHGRSEDCILISQDWLTGDADICGERCTPLFSTPGVLPIASPQFQTVDVSPFDQTPYRLIWTRLPLHSLNAAQMFQAIANRERRSPVSVVLCVCGASAWSPW